MSPNPKDRMAETEVFAELLEAANLRVYGRHIELRVAQELDEYGQFAVHLYLDGVRQLTVHFTDKSETT